MTTSGVGARGAGVDDEPRSESGGGGRHGCGRQRRRWGRHTRSRRPRRRPRRRSVARLRQREPQPPSAVRSCCISFS